MYGIKYMAYNDLMTSKTMALTIAAGTVLTAIGP
jgi:hypothetical protein